MAKIIITGLCSGTETKHSAKSGKDYQVTSFAEIPSMKSIQLFGDFGLPLSREVKEYVFEAGVTGLEFPRLISSGADVPPVKKAS